MKWYLDALKQYANFSGRAHRPAYWWFFLWTMVIFFILALVDGLFGTFSTEVGMGLISGLFMLAMMIPSIAVGARRLHDTGKSGWWQLMNVIPWVGTLVLLVMLARPGVAGENRYGAEPH